MALGLASASAVALETNLQFKADLTLKESYDSNVYLQDTDPAPSIPRAVQPFQDSLVTSVTPRLGLDWKPCPGFAATVSYAPEVTFYHSESSEDYVAHRGMVVMNGKMGAVAWEQPNAITWIDGNDQGLYFGGPGGAPAIGGIPLRDRRAAFIYRGGFRATWEIDEHWFLRPVTSAYVHDFFTDQRDSRKGKPDEGYENYVDRSDANGGADFGYTFKGNTRTFFGYRYGYQDEGPLITEPYQYDNQYHRLLIGVEGQPAQWLKLGVALGPDFHHTTAFHSPGFSKDYTVLYVDSVATLIPTKSDTIALTVKQYTQPAFASCSIYEDTTYDILARHKFDAHWSAGAGFRAYVGDWLAPVSREDWIYTPSTSVGYTWKKLNVELAYSYDWVDSRVPNTAGREFTRHLVWLQFRYSL